MFLIMWSSRVKSFWSLNTPVWFCGLFHNRFVDYYNNGESMEKKIHLVTYAQLVHCFLKSHIKSVDFTSLPIQTCEHP